MTAGFAFEWCLHAFHGTWQGTAAALLLMGAARLWESRRPALASTLLTVAFVKFLLPPMLSAPSGLFSLFPAVPARGIGRGRTVFAVAAAVHAAGMAFALFRLAREQRAIVGIWRRASERAAAPIRPLLESRCRKAGMSAVPELRVSAEIEVPFAWGILRPSILLPSRLAQTASDAALSLVVAHEVAHARRRDPARSVVESIAGALWWFNPVVGKLIARQRALREERCDAEVLRLSPGSAREYSLALVEAAALGFPVRAIGVGSPATGTGRELAHRLLRIARPGRSFRFSVLEAAVILAAVAILLPGVRPGHSGPLGRSVPIVRTP